jgi:uncharacterized protein YjbI with pentapeptide repeats
MSKMTPRRSIPAVIGVTQSPDIVSEQLQRIAIEKLEARLVLEDVLVESASLHGADAGSVRLERVYLKDVDLGDAKLRAIHLVDVTAERIDGANGDWGGGQLRRVCFQDARLTGLNLSEARIEEVSFKGCKLDYVNFRHSKIEHALFEDCGLRGADFQGARIGATRFVNCQLVEADFSKTHMSFVDLRGSELALAGSVLALSGAIIDSLQLMDVARSLALELGITVEDA